MSTESINSSGNDATEYLSTVSEMNPYKVLEQFDSATVLLIVVGIWTRHSHTGLLEEKGVWVQSLWQTVLARVPKIQGCRLLWNTLFFATPTDETARIKALFQDILQSSSNPSLESFCLISETDGDTSEKLLVLDEMQKEISPNSFGSNKKFQFRLRDGKP